MQLEIQNPQFETILFFVILTIIITITVCKKKKSDPLFPNETTQDLKGFAILTIIFGHIGYFLDSQDKFLYPLSIASGVGVNIFLFLSGYGLTVSALKRKLSLFGFYKKRLLRLFIPMWIVLTSLLLLDWQVHGHTYDKETIIHNLLGFFPVADIYTSINSVLWYFTFIFFYYLVFSFFTLSKKLLLIAPLAIFLITDFVLKQELPINRDVLTLYRLHTYAFPLGVAVALIPTYSKLIPKAAEALSTIIENTKKMHWLLRQTILFILAYIFTYTAFNSGIGETERTEKTISMISTLSIVAFFALNRYRSKALEILGLFSYEIYLLHWPLVYRYDFLYKYLPASFATVFYILIMLGIAFALQKSTELIARKLKL